MISTEQNEKIYEFGDFRLIPGEELLLHRGEPIALNPKSFAVLALLVERHGHLVQKSEIIDQIWEGSFVEEGAISKSVWHLRKALGVASKEEFIQTIAKRGYRFIAPVTVLNDGSKALLSSEHVSTGYRLPTLPENNESDPVITSINEHATGNGVSPAVSATASEAQALQAADLNIGRYSRKSGVLTVFIGLAVILGSVSVYFTLTNRSIWGVSDSRSIAVLPVRPVDAQTRNTLYELGIADALIQKISATKRLSVRQLNAVRGYVDLEGDPIKAGKEQKVDWVLASHYQIANGKIKVTAQLLNVATGDVEETFNADENAADFFSAQNDIANRIGNGLLARFGVDGSDGQAKWGTSDEEAYRLYQQGMFLVDKRKGDQAIDAFDGAIRLDPNYAGAWAGKAMAHRVSASTGGRFVDVHEEHKRSMQAVNRALVLDTNLPVAHAALCENRLLYEYDLGGAEIECKLAIELDRNSARAHQIYANVLGALGRFGEATAEIKTAMDLEPKSIFNQRIYGHILFWQHRFPDADAQFERIREMDQNTPVDQWTAVSRELQGKESEAFDAYMSMYRNAGEESIQSYRTAYRAVGWQGFLRERVKRFESSGLASYMGAFYCVQAGDKEKAFEYLERSFQRREVWLTWLKVDPRLDPIRDDPGYADLVRRIDGK